VSTNMGFSRGGLRPYRVMSAMLVALVAGALSACSDTYHADVVDVEVYFVADTAQGLRLFSEIWEVDSSTEDVAFTVVRDLVSGALQPRDPDYVNLWDSSHSLLEITIDGTRATIDLDLGSLSVGAEGEQRALDQVVWTLIGIQPTIEDVVFLVDGEPVETIAGHVDTSLPLTRDVGFRVLSPVQILFPAHGVVLEGPVVVSGEACTFEANVVWSLLSDDTIVADGAASAQAACPDRSAWSVSVGVLEPGDYVFRAQDISAEDGSVIAEDSKAFKVR
jgi:hypothetical protein